MTEMLLSEVGTNEDSHRRSGESRSPEDMLLVARTGLQSVHWIPACSGMTETHRLVSHFVTGGLVRGS